MTALTRLFGDSETFVDHYRRGQMLHNRTAGFEDLFSIESADRLIGAGRLRVPHDALMARAAEAGASTAERWREAMRGTSPEPFDPDVAVAGFDCGDTIILHGLQRRDPAIDRFAFDLETEVGQPIDVNAFLTPSRSQALEPHYDHHDVLILQVEGSKNWTVWEATVEDPLPEYAPDQFVTGGARHEIGLDEGDVLYIPRGWPHVAATSAEPSLHLTVAIIPIAWLEAAYDFLASLDREPALRRSLPFGYHRDPSLLVEGIEHTIGLVRSTIASCDVELAAKELSGSVAARRSTRVGRLSEIVSAQRPLDAASMRARASRPGC